jgi:hypothetical protein
MSKFPPGLRSFSHAHKDRVFAAGIYFNVLTTDAQTNSFRKTGSSERAVANLREAIYLRRCTTVADRAIFKAAKAFDRTSASYYASDAVRMMGSLYRQMQLVHRSGIGATLERGVFWSLQGCSGATEMVSYVTTVAWFDG